MSTETTTRRRARAEQPEQPEPEHEGEPDGTEETQPEPQPEPDTAEAQARKLDTAHRKYLKDLERIVGAEDMATMTDCPYCGGFSVVPEPMALQTREDTETCPDCRGLGQMFTGSRVPGQDKLPCVKCSGNGYVHKHAPAASNVRPLPQPAPQPMQQVHGWFDPVSQQFHPYGESTEGA